MNLTKALNIEKKYLIFMILSSGFFALIWDLSRKDLENKKQEETIVSPDTYVPDGYVLVPIEVQNAEALNAILGNFGVVDIFYPPSESNRKAIPLARQVKILRAPLDPQKFAVLVPSEQSQNLVKINSPLFVTIHNPKRQNTQFINTKISKSRVEYESF